MQIVVTDATIAYGELVVFQHFTASFPSGRVSALVGPSGCGKSSLLAAMAGLQRLNSGEIHIRRDDDPGQARPSPGDVAWVSQGSNGLGARSCVDNVMIAGLSRGASLSAARERASLALDLVRLGGRADQRANTLSGGELQRLALARGLAADACAVFADEPTANLDEENTRQVASILQGLSGSTTIVVATHDPLLIAAADDVIRLRPSL
jgi:ABC-type lipoprotein export system ATPase subunit